MKITPNDVLGNNNKKISFYKESMISSNGPNMVGRVDLSTISIPYDSYFTASISLQANSVDIPIYYGIGTDITFILLKANYTDITNLNTRSVCSGTTTGVEYYFEDEPLIKRKFNDIMILSGNDTYRIPQIYLNNSNNNAITVEFMVANLNPNEISSLLYTNYSDINGLVFNSILSDQIYSFNGTGSTQFEIIDLINNNSIQMVIPYSNIDILQLENEKIKVKTKNDDSINLIFVSEFNARQTYSRMNWVIENSSQRYLTPIYPGLDTTAPTIYWNTLGNPTSFNTTGITRDDLRLRFIDYVEDFDDNSLSRDGIINNSNVNITIIKTNTGEIFDIIITDGTYNISFSVTDLATNTTNATKTLLVDSTPPVIYFLSGVTNTMSLTANTQTPGTIEKNDIIRYYIDYIWDNVDLQIANGNCVITISQGTSTFTNITASGIYTLNFSVSDASGNVYSTQKTVTIIN